MIDNIVHSKMLLSEITENPFNYKDFFEKYFTIFDASKKDNGYYSKLQLNEQQEEFLNLILNNEYVVCKKGRQLGGTTLMAVFLLTQALLSQENRNYIYIAPNSTCAKDMHHKVYNFLKQLPLGIFQNLTTSILNKTTQKIIKFGNGVTMRFYDVNNFDLIGFSDIDLIVLDDVSNMELSSLFNCLSVINTIKTKIIALSTPKKGDIIFKEMYDKALVKFSLDWWRDPRYNKNLFWIKENDILYRTHGDIDDLILNGWLPTNEWCENMKKAFNNNEDTILTEIYNQFV